MERRSDVERPLVPVAGADRAPRDRGTDATLSLTVHTHADGRQIVVRRATDAAGRTVHLDAVVR